MGDENQAAGTDQAVETPTPDPKKELGDLIGEKMADAMAPVASAMGDLAKAMADLKTEPEKTVETPTPTPAEDDFEAKVKAAVAANMADYEPEQMSIPSKVMLGAPQPRVMKAVERYSSTKTALIYPPLTKSGKPHPRAGEHAVDTLGNQMDMLSDREKAVAGAWIRQQLAALSPTHQIRINQHEKDLIQYAIHEMPWVGPLNCDEHMSMKDRDYMKNELLSPDQRKAVIDDATSGGSYATPSPTDNLLIQEPLLHGELFPLVTLRPATSSSVQHFTVGDVTLGKTAEGTNITVLSTTGLISNLDTTIYPVNCIIELGLDWLSDVVSPLNFANIWQQNMGEKILEWLDDQIANGDGTTEPEGIFTKSGTASVSAGEGTSGPYVTADLENLQFSVSKPRRARNRCVYVMHDIAYKRYRAIITATNYQTRAQGMEYQNYMLSGYPAKIQNNINRAYSAFCDMTDYIMYRRLGAQFRTTDQGLAQFRKNTMLVQCRARFGGQLALAAACAVMTDGDSTDG